MIIWISGNTGSGKTYLANKLEQCIPNVLHLDGDIMRGVWTDLGLSKADRWENNLRNARLAKALHDQNFNVNVIVSVIAPYIKLREEITAICDPTWIYMPSIQQENADYESPKARHK